jgi:hypothetical protein
MFDDYWRIHSRSHASAGKRTVKTPYFYREITSQRGQIIAIITVIELGFIGIIIIITSTFITIITMPSRCNIFG